MKILVIATGGTIGSVEQGGSIDVRTDTPCAVADLYAREHPEHTLDVIVPLNILSESITAGDLNQLAKAILEADTAAYDGVICTCGSDNLGYLSALLALLWGDRPIPLFVVASNRLLTLPGSNGYENFCCAVEVMRGGLRGAFVPYRNDDGVMYLHAAADLRQADGSDDFFSFHGAYATYDGAVNERRPYISHRIPSIFGADALPLISDSVLLLHPYPMLDYGAIRHDGKRAVLHTLYHSGTLDSDSAAALCDRLGEIPLYLAPLRSGRPLYRTTADMLSRGAIPLYDIAPECAYMKLLLACAQDQMSIRAFMEDEA